MKSFNQSTFFWVYFSDIVILNAINFLKSHKRSWNDNLICKSSCKVRGFRWVLLLDFLRLNKDYLLMNLVKCSYMSHLSMKIQSLVTMAKDKYSIKQKINLSNSCLEANTRQIKGSLIWQGWSSQNVTMSRLVLMVLNINPFTLKIPRKRKSKTK